MKNRKLRISVAVMLIVAVCASVLSGCMKGSGDKLGGGFEEVTGGLHQINVTKTSRVLISGGASEYKIVVSADAGELTNMVVNDMVQFIKSAASCELEVIADTGLTHSADSKYISVGINDLYTSAGVTFDREQLLSNGYRIVTKDKSVYMGGVSEYADSNAVYEFLRHTINFGAYSAQAFTYDKSDTVYLHDFDVAERPDFEWRRYSSGSMNSPAINMRRMRFNNMSDVIAPVGGGDVHNFSSILPREKHQEDHPAWYSHDSTQLCLTAHGDPDELEAMYQEIVNMMKQAVIDNPAQESVSFTQNDFNTWCLCEDCQASYNTYRTDAAVLIKFCNELSRRMQAWIADNDDGIPADKVFNICFFAYQKTESAPVNLNSDGTYSPIDDSVVCDPNVIAFIAPLNAEYIIPLNVGANYQYSSLLDQWQVLSEKFYLWIYQTNYRNYMYPYHSINSMAENLRLAYKYNTTFIFNQGQYGQNLSTAFNELKVFLDSKLMWNLNYNVNDLIKEYFDNCFLDASDAMMEYYNELYTWMHYVHNDMGLAGGVYSSISKLEYWPVRMLEGFMQKIEKAYAAIEKYKSTDTVFYNEVYDRICLESLFPRFALATLHKGSFSDIALYNLRKGLSDDIIRFSIDHVEEGKSMQEVLASWGV